MRQFEIHYFLKAIDQRDIACFLGYWLILHHMHRLPRFSLTRCHFLQTKYNMMHDDSREA